MLNQKTVLSNGVTILSESFDSVRSISLGVWFQVGSRDELDSEAGLSHFNEHMMFKGTPSRNAREISELFDAYGARQNAFTSREATCYYASFIDESLPEVFSLIADMVQNSEFKQEHCELEREVVIEEIARSEDDPEDRVYELFSRSFLPDHGLGRAIAGTRQSVGSFGSEDAHQYHEKHYHAHNCVIVASGNVSHEQLVALASHYFGDMKSGLANNAQKRESPTILKSGTLSEYMPIEQSHILIGTEAIPAYDERSYAYTLTNFILGGSMSSRLFQEVREKQGLVYTIYSGTSLYTDFGQFVIYAGTRPENSERVIETSLLELAKMAKGEISDDDLKLANSAIRGSLALGLESTSGRMKTLGQNYLNGKEILSFEERLERFARVTREELVSVAEKLQSKEKLIAVVGPKE